ncbi:uncharacterized protein SETTUDRAFT_27389 [Exserohilum turcica Et28A]|uniref:SWIM-type domain-containing protein n=1 Tax=Exserohilum turcicum (strain 28A) TaxID=671987 RepID=R0IUY4_EXST2|nr:uncharacterized protein SETTUDRAFT_27389 [Exserohilum turcica Et28A]EOA88585.1 hypothetical protein SETTUDRAFT_27389 [Exserohilum turcica Et28A]
MSLPRPRNRRFVTRLLTSLDLAATPPDHDRLAAAPVTPLEPNHNPLARAPDAARRLLLALQVLFPTEFVPALDLLDRRLVTRFRLLDQSSIASAAIASTDEVREGHAEAERHVTMQGGDEHEQHEEAIHMRNAHDASKHHNTRTPSSSNDDTTVQEPNTTTTTTTTPPPIPQIPPIHNTYYVRSAQHRSSRHAPASYDATTSYQVRLAAWNCSCPAFAFAAFPAGIDDDEVDDTYHYPENEQNHAYEQEYEYEEQEQQHPACSFGGMTLGDHMPPVCKHLLACVLAESCPTLFGAFVQEKHVTLAEAAAWAAGWGD